MSGKSTSFKKLTIGLCALLLNLILISQTALADSQEQDTEAIGWLSYALSSNNHSGAKSDDSSLGYAVADAVCLITDSDIAIVNGGDLADITLETGDVYQQDILDCFIEDRQLAVAEVTPKQLFAIMEIGVSRIIVDIDTAELLHSESEFDGFPQVSGIEFDYDASAPEGERILWIKWNGSRLDAEDEETVLMLAGTEYLLEGGYGSEPLEYTSLDLTLSEVFTQYVADGISTNYDNVDRMNVSGCSENYIINQIPMGILVAIVVIFGLSGLMRGHRRRQFGDYNWDERDYEYK